MYLPSDGFQLQAAPVLDAAGLPEAIDNATKHIEDLLKLCSAAGLDERGFACGMSIAVVLALLAAFLMIILVFVIPAILGLIGNIILLIGKVILGIIAGILAVILGVFKLVGNIVSAVFGTIFKIISLPCRPCMRALETDHSPLDAPRPQQSQQATGVLPGQIRYTREPSSSPEIVVRPPSYHSDDEYVDPLLASGRK